MSGRSIEAVLKLDYSNFQTGVTTVEGLVNRLNKSLESISSVKTSNDFVKFNNVIEMAINHLKNLSELSKESKSFNLMASGINKTANALKLLDSVTNSDIKDFSQLGNILSQAVKLFNETSAEVTKLSNSEHNLDQSTSSVLGELSHLGEKIKTINQEFPLIANNINTTSTSIKDLGDEAGKSKDHFNTFNKQLDEANSKLSSISKSSKSASSSLKVVNQMLMRTASHYLYQGLEYIRQQMVEIYKSKTEMNSWINMLGFTTKQTNAFNTALDKTVSKFQRVNKYQIGETIASIGVEFDLSEKEMEKALDVTSMITNEYLRAGRNSDEASLAVKDILQGQFQRLSRETGVKEKDLVATGFWDGEDTTDVMGIMKALEKVAKDRNWDTIAQKATSVNDIMTIGQNRITEWSADLIDHFTPALVGTFNSLMDVFGYVQSTIDGTLNWLGGDGLGQSIVKWSSLATAIASVTTGLVKYRTGASLAQISQMGLKNSIVATVLGLDAENVALHGSLNVIKSKITGLKEEKVQYISLRNVIVSRILGLKSETLAEKGVIEALKESIATKRIDQYNSKIQRTLSLKNGIALSGEATAIKLVKDETTGAIVFKDAYALSTETQTGASLGFVGALKAMVFGEVEAEATTLSLAGSIGALTGAMLMNPITWFAGALIALGGAFYIATGGLSDHWEKMQQYNSIMDDSSSVIDSHKAYLEQLKKEVGETSEKYKTASESVEEFNENLGHSKAYHKKLEDTIGSQDVQMSTALKLNSQYAGMSDKDIDSLLDGADAITTGMNTEKHALEVLNKQSENFEKSDRTLLKHMQDRNADIEDINNKRTQHMEHMANLQKHSLEHNTATDWWGGTWAGMLAGVDSFQVYLDYKTEDLANWWHDVNTQLGEIQTGLTNWINNFDIGKTLGDIGNYISSHLNNWFQDIPKSIWGNEDETWASLFKPLTDLFEKVDLGKLWDDFTQEFMVGADDFKKRVLGLPQWIADSAKYMAINLYKNSGLGKAIDGLGDWWKEKVEWYDNNVKPLIDGFMNSVSDPLSKLSELINNFKLPDINLGDLLFGWIDDFFLFASDTESADTKKAEEVGAIPVNEEQWESALGDPTDVKQKAEESFVDYIMKMIPSLDDITQFLGIDGLLSGAGDLLDTITNAFDTYIIQPISDFISDPIGFLGDMVSAEINGWDMIGNLLGLRDIGTGAMDFVNNNIIQPFTSALNDFISDPIGFLGNIQWDIVDFIGSLFGVNDASSSIKSYIQGIFDITDIVNNFKSTLTGMWNTATTIASYVGTAFNNLKTVIWGHISGMISNVTTGFTTIKDNAVSKITALKDGVQGAIDKVKDAFVTMKDSILHSAKLIMDGVKEKFDKVKDTIGGFYNKLTNPSSWGSAGQKSYSSSPKPQTARRMFSPVISRTATHHGAGINPYTNSNQEVKLKDLISLVDGDNKVKLSDFVAMFNRGGFGAWDFHDQNKNRIFDTAKTWKTGSPNIQGIGVVGEGYEVSKFWDGNPKFSFDDFVSVAQAIFSAIPYKFYYDSEWKGNWVNALLSGATNCNDGSEALIALARVFGFDGYKQHTTLKSGIGHFFAVINGHKMDTTNFQNHGSWSPLGGAGVPVRRSHTSNGSSGSVVQGKTINITNDFSGAVIYGVDDFDDRVTEATRKVLREEFANPYAVPI